MIVRKRGSVPGSTVILPVARPYISLLCIVLLSHQNVDSFAVQHPARRPAFGYPLRTTDDDMEPVILPTDDEPSIAEDDLQLLTVAQLQQQLRLRGLKVSGRKQELIDRLLRASGGTISDARKFAEERGKELIDVSAYLDEGDMGQDFKSSNAHPEIEEENKSTEPEVWGTEARIVDDYEGRSPVIDSLTRANVEFRGSNSTQVQAYVVGSRDALKPFMAGGVVNETKPQHPVATAEARLKDIQTKREQAARRPVRFEDETLVDEGDETGIFSNILDRDFSDWGKYTQTGAQLSAAEVQGVLILSDVYGAFNADTRALADKIAFECQPVVVMVPDLFGDDPWIGPTSGTNARGQSYEEWRATHSDIQTSVNIRAAAACLRERYGVSSIVLWGTCYGGGRALESAVGWLPNNQIHDIDGNIGPPLVEPMAVVAWYPTRYNVRELFGPSRRTSNIQLAVMAVFAGKDKHPGATKEDAALLKQLLDSDDRVKDHMVKVFPDQEHGFAHVGLSKSTEGDDYERFVDEEFGGAGRVSIGDGDAEVACLLSTAFMETYSRVFLPTVGNPISRDENAQAWNKELEIRNLQDAMKRDVRKEIDDAVDSFVEEPLGGFRIDPTDKSQEEELERLLRTMQDPDMEDGPFKIQDDDDLPTIYAKLTSSDENFQLF